MHLKKEVQEIRFISGLALALSGFLTIFVCL
jgi:hypothetical protein